MTKLTKLLEYACAGNSKKRSLMDNDSFVNTFNNTERELLLSDAGQNGLIQREVIGAIVEGAKSRESARKIIPIINTTGPSCRIVYGTSPSGQYASYVGEGAAVPIDTEKYASSNIAIKKAAVRPVITREMIEDSKFDQIELELKKAGAKLENKLNQEVITKMLSPPSGTAYVDPNGAHIGTYDIGVAKGKVDNNGWMADSFIVNTPGFGYLIDETNMPEISDENHKLLGLNTVILDAQTDGTISQYWDGTDATDHFTGIVFDSLNHAVIAMRDDVKVEMYDDPIHDLIGMVVSMRFGVGILNSGAACRILAK